MSSSRIIILTLEIPAGSVTTINIKADPLNQVAFNAAQVITDQNNRSVYLRQMLGEFQPPPEKYGLVKFGDQKPKFKNFKVFENSETSFKSFKNQPGEHGFVMLRPTY